MFLLNISPIRSVFYVLLPAPRTYTLDKNIFLLLTIPLLVNLLIFSHHAQAEDHRNAQPVLGRVKNLHLGNENHDPNTVFGRPTFSTRTGGRGRITADEIMKGEHNKEHRKNWIEMDRDLGTAVAPGYRNITWVISYTLIITYKMK